MSTLIKRIEPGMISILQDGQVQVREDTVVEEDGVEISRTYHRTVLEPTAEPQVTDPRLLAILRAAWTPEVVAAFEVARAERLARSPVPGVPHA